MSRLSEPFVLSTTGSTRATSYNWGNKILTRDGKTHVVWLDAVATICGRTYDHSTGEWGDTVRIDEGSDNHSAPCITADEAGHIRLTYGPHGWNANWNQARIKWRRTTRPGSMDTWEPEGENYHSSHNNFGYNATAASIVHTPSGLDAVICRGGEHPPSTMFHRQRTEGGWTSAKELLGQQVEPQYTHNYGHITCTPDGTLYTACHFYNIGGSDNQAVTGDRSRMRSYGAAVLKSTDLGATWTNLRDEAVTLPTVYGHDIAIPPFDQNIYINSIVADTGGRLWAITVNPGIESDGLWLSQWQTDGWRTIELQSYLPSDRVAVESMLTIDTQDRLHVVVTTVQPEQVGTDSFWGHPSSEVFYLVSMDGGDSFAATQLSETDPAAANWLPSIASPGPFHPVESPTLMYTHGAVGEGLRPATQTEVRCLHVLD